MAPIRISNRIRRQREAAQEVTPAISNVSKKKKKQSARNSVSSSNAGASSSRTQRRSLTRPKSTPASSRVLRNPYAKKNPPVLLPQGSPSGSEHSSAGNESSSVTESSSEFHPTPPPAALPRLPPSSETCLLPAIAASVPLFQPNTSDGSIDFSTVGAQANQDFTLSGILQSIADNGRMRIGPNVLAEDIGDLYYNTKDYEKAKTTMVNRFFQTLVNHPQAHPLADMIPDPEDPTRKVRRLYILCRAPKAPNKHFLLNRALLIFSMKHVKVAYVGMDLSQDPQLFADAQYEPDTAQTAFKMLFSRFSKEGIAYSQSRDFNGKGNVLLLFVGRFVCERTTLVSC